MKNTIFALICAIGVLSFTSSENLNNDNFEEYCNESYTINGGPGCQFNGSYDGWCSEAEFNDFANSVYGSNGCSDPNTLRKKD